MVDTLFRDIVSALCHCVDKIVLYRVVEFIMRTADEVDYLRAVMVHDMADHHFGDRFVVVNAVLKALGLEVESDHRSLEVLSDTRNQALSRTYIVYAGRKNDDAVEDIKVDEVVDRVFSGVEFGVAGHHERRKDSGVHICREKLFLYCA